jgi:FkbM family methyltransferase
VCMPVERGGPPLLARLGRDRAKQKKRLNSLMRFVGLGVEPSYHSLAAHRGRVLARHGVGRVIDVGANVGQYAGGLRAAGYTGEIVSFEANPAAAAGLRAAAESDPGWRAEGVALGAVDGVLDLHVTVDSLSTSLLTPAAGDTYEFMAEAPQSVRVDVRPLDAFELTADGVATLLKLDVQGYELEVLAGAAATLAQVSAVECELSLVPLYDGQALVEDVVAHLRAAGLRPICLTRGFTDPASHEVIQLDGIFLRDGSAG